MKFENYLKEDMGAKYKCNECGWIYDPEKEGKPFADQPDTYKCPKCDVPKSDFTKMKRVKLEG